MSRFALDWLVPGQQSDRLTPVVRLDNQPYVQSSAALIVGNKARCRRHDRGGPNGFPQDPETPLPQRRAPHVAP